MRHHVLRMLWVLACLILCGVVHAGKGKVTYIYTDPQGTPIAEADEQGNITKTFDYRPYGQQALGQPPDGPGYTGHVNDPDTDLVYMQARYYDPEIGRFLSTDPVEPKPGDLFGFNRYAYANNNPIVNADPDGRCPVCIIAIPVFIGLMTHSDYANAPGPGEPRMALSTVDHLSAITEALPPGRVASLVRMGVSAGNVSQRAATREAKRQAGIPTSQQPISQTNGKASDGTRVGRQQTFEVPKEQGGTEIKSVQVSRDRRGDHAGMPQIEAGSVKPGGQTDTAGRPRIQNEDKIRVDFNPGR